MSAALNLVSEVRQCLRCCAMTDETWICCPSCGHPGAMQPAPSALAKRWLARKYIRRRVEEQAMDPMASSMTEAVMPSVTSVLESMERGEELKMFAPVEEIEADSEEEDEDEDEEEDDIESEEPLEATEIGAIRSKGVRRFTTGDATFDYVLNGGLPQYHALMLAASPGAGKSTLLRKCAGAMAQQGLVVMYASGEEPGDIIKEEFKRCGIFKKYPKARKVIFVSSNDPDRIIRTAYDNNVDVLIVDSIAVMISRHADGPAGEKNQVKYAAEHFMHVAHAEGKYEGRPKVTVLTIAHATKGNDMAGPNAAKHWTDGTFFLEHIDPLTLEPCDNQNEPTGFMRLRAHGKYRRGPTTRRGYYRMDEDGIHEWEPENDNAESEGKKAPRKTRASEREKKTASSKRPPRDAEGSRSGRKLVKRKKVA